MLPKEPIYFTERCDGESVSMQGTGRALATTHTIQIKCLGVLLITESQMSDRSREPFLVLGRQVYICSLCCAKKTQLGHKMYKSQRLEIR